jgi:hypothetical protein
MFSNLHNNSSIAFPDSVRYKQKLKSLRYVYLLNRQLNRVHFEG